MAIETDLTYAIGPPNPPTSVEDWVTNYFCHWILYPDDDKVMCGGYWDGHDLAWEGAHYFHSGKLMATGVQKNVHILRERN